MLEWHVLGAKCEETMQEQRFQFSLMLDIQNMVNLVTGLYSFGIAPSSPTYRISNAVTVGLLLAVLVLGLRKMRNPQGHIHHATVCNANIMQGTRDLWEQEVSQENCCQCKAGEKLAMPPCLARAAVHWQQNCCQCKAGAWEKLETGIIPFTH